MRLFLFLLLMRSASVVDLFKGIRHLQAVLSNLKSSCHSRNSHTSIDPSVRPERIHTVERKGRRNPLIQCLCWVHTHTESLIHPQLYYSRVLGALSFTHTHTQSFHWRYQPAWVCKARFCHSWGGRIWLTCPLTSAGIWQSFPKPSAAPGDRAPAQHTQDGDGLITVDTNKV